MQVINGYDGRVGCNFKIKPDFYKRSGFYFLLIGQDIIGDTFEGKFEICGQGRCYRPG